MKIHCKYDELVPLKKLVPYSKNRNKHPQEQIERLAKLIDYQGQRAPIIVGTIPDLVTGEPTDPRICKGHGTAGAIELLGEKSAAVVYQAFENEDQRYAFVQSDNAIASWAELDLAGINQDIGELDPDFDIELLGLQNFEIEPADKYGYEDPDAIPDTPKQAKSKPGDLFLLGAHRLMCGDSTRKEHVERLMAGERADFTITSPPYNVGLAYNSYEDKKSEADYVGMIKSVLENCRAVAAEDYWLLWNVGVFPLSLHLSLLRDYFTVQRSIAWVKQGITGPPMLYHMKQNPVVKNYQPNFGWEIIACCHINKELKGTRRIPDYVIEEAMTDVWEVSQHKDAKDQAKHPGTFPVKIPERAIQLYAESNVYEPFSGSGSTLIACEKTVRKFFGMELDPVYIDVILDRWAKFTGQEPKREDGKKWSQIKAEE